MFWTIYVIVYFYIKGTFGTLFRIITSGRDFKSLHQDAISNIMSGHNSDYNNIMRDFSDSEHYFEIGNDLDLIKLLFRAYKQTIINYFYHTNYVHSAFLSQKAYSSLFWANPKITRDFVERASK